jgi:hypothetical protein
MAEIPPVDIEASWDYDDEGFRRLSSDLDSAGTKYEATSGRMDMSNIRLMRSVAHLGTGFASLYSIMDMLASGQANLARMIPALIGHFISLAATLWMVVGAEKARAIAHGIANALSGPAGWAILAGAVAMSGVAMGLAATIPSRQAGGPIYRTGTYQLERGEVYKRGFGAGINITITGNTVTRETLPLISSKIIDDLRASGVIR